MDKQELMKYARLVEDLDNWGNLKFEDEYFEQELSQFSDMLYSKILATVGQLTIEEYQEKQYYKGFNK